jgi:hypothetical protein
MAENNDINEIFRELVQKSLPEQLITNFVIVAEVTDEDSSQLNIFVSDTMSPWLAHGMLEYAINMIDNDTDGTDKD